MSSLTIQFPEQLLAEATAVAQREQISVEAYCLRVLEEQITSDASWQRLIDGGKHVSRDRFLQILREAPDVEPDPDDRIE